MRRAERSGLLLSCALVVVVALAGCGGQAEVASSPPPVVHAAPAARASLEAQMRDLLRRVSAGARSTPPVPPTRCFREGSAPCVPVCRRLLATGARVDCATPRSARGRRVPVATTGRSR